MRKILLLLAIIATLALCSCGDDGEDYGFIENATFDPAQLFGRWDVEYIKEPANDNFWHSFYDLRMTFGSAGKFTAKFSSYEYNEIEINADYNVKGDIISVDNGIIIIKLTQIDDYDAYFTMTTYFSEDGGDSKEFVVYCKGKKRN